MKILIINSFYYPNMIGGAEHSVKLLAETLTHYGHKVSVYTLDATPEKADPIQIDLINNVTIYRGYNANFTKDKHFNANNRRDKYLCRITSFRNKSIKKDLDYIMFKFSPDVVHTNNMYGISTYVWKYFHQKGIRVVYTIRDYFLFDPKAHINGSCGFILKIYQSYYKKQSSRYVDVVTAPSKYTLDIFCDKGYFINSTQQCVVNSIEINDNEVKQIVDRKCVLQRKEIIFLFVGALTHDKGIDNLLKAFSQVRFEFIKLKICGSGPLKNQVLLAQDIDKRIEYKGQLSMEDMKLAYREADVLVAPSTWDEPFGRIIIEGNQYGLAIIGANKAGIAEILETMHSGEGIDSDSIDDIARAIWRFSTRSYYLTYLKNIKANLRKYSIDYQVDSFLELYKNPTC